MSDNEKDNKLEKQLEKKFTRRNFMRGAGLTVGGIAIGGGIGAILAPKPEEKVIDQAHHSVSNIASDYTEAMQFFTRKEDFDVLAAATEIIFPEDEHGPGAIGLGAPYYIDKQLASPWGKNVDDYRVRPFTNGQTPLTRGDIMIQGVRKLNEVSQQKHETTFSTLDEEEQIAILQEFEIGNIEMSYVSSNEFFALLRQLTLEGCYCDPMYGGNKNMDGWRMKEFPGAYMSYLDVVEAEEFVKKEPMSLSDHFH